MNTITRSAVSRLRKFTTVYRRHLFATANTSTLESPAQEGNPDAKTYPPHIEQLVDSISNLTLLECADLNELLKKRLGIQGSAGMMPMMAAPLPSSGAEEDDEAAAASTVKTSYTVKLLKFDTTKKVPLIKEIKQLLPEMNLVQAKKFVESAPEVLKTDITKDEADKIKESLEAVGGTIAVE